MLKVNSKKFIIINIAIMAVLALLTVWTYKSDNMFNSALPVISSFSLLTFDITIKNTFNQNKTSIILNTLLYSIAFLAVYHMILLVFGIDLEIIAKLLFIQIFLEMYSIARFFSNSMKLINKVIFYALFFIILLGVFVYYKNFNIDILLLSVSIASVVSALYIVIISSCRKE